MGITMRNALYLCLLPVLWSSGRCVAAEDANVMQQIQVVRSLTEGERQRTLVDGARLSSTEMAAFVPLYQEYRRHVVDVNDELLRLLQDYSKEYESLDDSEARALTRRWFATERERLELKERYAKKFEAALPATKVARVMQIENRLDLLQLVGAASVIPLVNPG